MNVYAAKASRGEERGEWYNVRAENRTDAEDKLREAGMTVIHSLELEEFDPPTNDPKLPLFEIKCRMPRSGRTYKIKLNATCDEMGRFFLEEEGFQILSSTKLRDAAE